MFHSLTITTVWTKSVCAIVTVVGKIISSEIGVSSVMTLREEDSANNWFEGLTSLCFSS